MKKLKLLFCIIFIFACSNNKQNKSTNKEVKYTAKVYPIELTNLDFYMFQEYSIQTIALETKEDCLIGEVSQLYITDKNILIFDRKGEQILLFDRNGEFLYKIGKKGKALDEYVTIINTWFDYTRNVIYALDQTQNTIYEYNISGEFNGKIKSKYSFLSFCKSGSDFWVYSCFKDNINSKGYNLMLLDSTLQIQKTAYFPQKEFINRVITPTFFTDDKGKNYFFYPTSNVIYLLSQNDIEPFIQVDLGEKTMPYDKIQELSTAEDYRKLIANKAYIGDIYNFSISEGRAYFEVQESGFGIAKSAYNCIYNLQTNKVMTYNNAFIESCNYNIFTHNIQSYNGFMVFLLRPEDIDEKWLPIKSPSFRYIIKEDSNPVVCIMKLK